MDTIDPLDARILLALDDDPGATTLGLARTLGVARNTVQARLRRLTAAGALTAFSRRVDPAALGFGLTAFTSLHISQARGDEAAARLRELPEVVEIHSITGEADLLVTVVARDTEDLRRTTRAVLTVPGVERTSTVISLREEMGWRTRSLLEARARG